MILKRLFEYRNNDKNSCRNRNFTQGKNHKMRFDSNYLETLWAERNNFKHLKISNWTGTNKENRTKLSKTNYLLESLIKRTNKNFINLHKLSEHLEIMEPNPDLHIIWKYIKVQITFSSQTDQHNKIRAHNKIGIASMEII